MAKYIKYIADNSPKLSFSTKRFFLAIYQYIFSSPYRP